MELTKTDEEFIVDHRYQASKSQHVCMITSNGHLSFNINLLVPEQNGCHYKAHFQKHFHDVKTDYKETLQGQIYW